jgi:hypothetical protein
VGQNSYIEDIIMALPASFGPAEVKRLKDLIYDGVKTKEEIQSLTEGMADTVKAIAEELQIPAGLLKKAINVAHKGNFNDVEGELKDLEQILTAVGRK